MQISCSVGQKPPVSYAVLYHTVLYNTVQYDTACRKDIKICHQNDIIFVDEKHYDHVMILQNLYVSS